MKKKICLLLCLLFVILCTVAMADTKIDARVFPNANYREYVKLSETLGNRESGEKANQEICANATFKVSPKEITLKVGETKTLKLKATISTTYIIFDTNKKLIEAKFGKVNADKLTMEIIVKGLKAGDTEFGVTRLFHYDDVVKVKVHVVDGSAPKADVPKISKKELSMKIGKQKTVTVTFAGTKTDLKIKVKNKKIASAEIGSWSGNKAKLKIKGLKSGNTTIEIYNAKDQSQKATIKVTVKK